MQEQRIKRIDLSSLSASKNLWTLGSALNKVLILITSFRPVDRFISRKMSFFTICACSRKKQKREERERGREEARKTLKKFTKLALD